MPRQTNPNPRARLLFQVCCAALLATSSRAAVAGAGVAGAAEAGEAEAAVTAAEQKASQAFEAYQGKRFAEAVALYIEAYAAAPNADILYNIARIYDTKLGDRPLALNFYRRYIVDPGAVADRVQSANERLVALREAEAAASQPAPASHAAPAAARAPSERAAELAGGWTSGEWAGAILGASGVVALGVGTGFGLVALDDTHTLHDLCDGSVCREQRGIDAAKSATDHARVSTIAFASGGALLAVGAAFYFWSGGDSEEKQAQAQRLELSGGPLLGQAGWSLELKGSW